MAEISPEERDNLLADEAQQLMNEFQVEIVDDAISRMRIYLSITLEKHYVMGIDFSNYPFSPPLITVQEEVQRVIGDPHSFELVKNWNPDKPPHIIEIIRLIESKLYDANKYWEQERLIGGEFNISKVPNEPNKLRIQIMTYGWKEYPFSLVFRDPPNPPGFEFPPEVEQLVGSLDNIIMYKLWDPTKYSINDLLREINWKIDKHSRLDFEKDLLDGALKNVTYDPATRKFTAEIKGTLKTSEMVFQFSVEIPEDYPAKPPNIALLSKVDDDTLAKQMQEAVGDMIQNWSPFNYLIDLFNSITKTIFKASVMVCIVCHSLECPTCKNPISAVEGEGEESCTAQCPHCQKPYHAHCWQRNIESIGKCAYCLRAPPSGGAGPAREPSAEEGPSAASRPDEEEDEPSTQ
jgi:ubiquitin-protein ligase